LKPSDGRAIEDTITLLVQWRNDDDSVGTATYTASWIAPKADSHTQQHFHIMGHSGEIRVNQAKRGYEMSTDTDGFAQLNPLYMKYTPSPSGHFAGQQGYGYRSIEEFVRAGEFILMCSWEIRLTCFLVYSRGGQRGSGYVRRHLQARRARDG
jgi:D-galacturonate reductase